MFAGRKVRMSQCCHVIISIFK